MGYFLLMFICLCLLCTSLYYFFKSRELAERFRTESKVWQEREAFFTSELSKVEKLRHVPGVLEKARKARVEAEAKLADVEVQAAQIIEWATMQAQAKTTEMLRDAEAKSSEAKAKASELIRDGETKRSRMIELAQEHESQANEVLRGARKEAREIRARGREAAREATEKAEEKLQLASEYAMETRRAAEKRAADLDAESFEAMRKAKDYESVLIALKNRVDGYESVKLAPTIHLVDELVDEYGFSRAGERLKLARERSRALRDSGNAVECGYPDGWKRDHAIKFVLSTFDGKVDTILSRIRAGNSGKLQQEIRDACALVNRDGEVYKNARITPEYLESRLEEAKWAVAVQAIKERHREEQRAIREQIREEQRAKREIDKALKQSAREEELVNKAIARLKQQFNEASEAEQAKLEAQLMELNEKLLAAEERGRKALSMAQQTKRGHVYVISNIGSFGENIYKIGLTRRLDPTERVRELGDASVPFPFDVHAMLHSEDAPALEQAFHKRFVENQVNKVNRRKEFFRASVQELRAFAQEMNIEGVWTIAAEASQYRESMAIEAAMKSNEDVRRRWIEEQTSLEVDIKADEDYYEEIVN